MKKNKGLLSLFLFITIIVITSLACGISDVSNLFATETPTPTLTFTPSPTFTASPTPTATQTPTATPVPTGVKIDEQADGSILFVDYDNKYQLTLPSEWVVIPFDQGELSALMDQFSNVNPQFVEAAEAFKNLDSDVFRLVALNKNENFFENGAAPNLNIGAVENDVLSNMPLSFVTGALEESFKQRGLKVLTEGVNIVENPHGVEIEYIDLEQTVNGNKVAQRLIVFQSNKKLILITITSLLKFSEEVLPSSDIIGASVEFLK